MTYLALPVDAHVQGVFSATSSVDDFVIQFDSQTGSVDGAAEEGTGVAAVILGGLPLEVPPLEEKMKKFDVTSYCFHISVSPFNVDLHVPSIKDETL